MPQTRGLAHVNLNVRDIDRSVRFYAGVFGLELLSDSTETIQRKGQSVELRQAVLSTPGQQDLLALSHAASFPIGSAGLNHIGFNFKSNEDVHTAIRGGPSHPDRDPSRADEEDQPQHPAHEEQRPGQAVEPLPGPFVTVHAKDAVTCTKEGGLGAPHPFQPATEQPKRRLCWSCCFPRSPW